MFNAFKRQRELHTAYSQQQTLSRFLHKQQALPEQFRLLNWNINKSRQPNAHQDLLHYSQDKELIFLQEAALGNSLYSHFTDNFTWSFSQGFCNQRFNTGVLTLAKATPLSCHRFSIREPLLRTPKASLITEYYIGGKQQTLLCINLHAVNFSLGTRVFKQQLKQLFIFIEHHQGPVLISGDFNTWRAARHYAVDDMMAELDMSALNYGTDKRKQAFGRALDHIFVKGLHLDSIVTPHVRSSDHNPIIAQLSLAI